MNVNAWEKAVQRRGNMGGISSKKMEVENGALLTIETRLNYEVEKYVIIS